MKSRIHIVDLLTALYLVRDLKYDFTILHTESV